MKNFSTTIKKTGKAPLQPLPASFLPKTSGIKRSLYLAIALLPVWTACNSHPETPALTEPAATVAKDTPAAAALTRNSDSAYSNPRYVYYLEYPGAQLVAQPESTNGDGRIFLDHAGEEVLRVWGCINEDAEGQPLSLEQKYRQTLSEWSDTTTDAPLAVSYQKRGKDFFVISGRQKDRIVYIKTIAKQDAFATLQLQYALRDSVVYRAATEAVSRSFHFLKDEHTGHYYPNSY